MRPPAPSARDCSRIRAQDPVHKIAFIKTHKTASSTLTNVFHRFGYKCVGVQRPGCTTSVAALLPQTPSSLCCHPTAVHTNRYGLNFALPEDNMFYGWPAKGLASVKTIQPIGLYQVRACVRLSWDECR